MIATRPPAGGAWEPEDLAAWLREAMERHRVPGAAVGLVHAGRETVVCEGVASLEDPLPVTPDTLFAVGSVTKTVTGTAVLRLVERGALQLDAPVRTYLPDLRLADEAAARRVTLRHLLTHTGGWVDDDRYPDTGSGDDAVARLVADLADRPQLAPPGLVSSYGNLHFVLAGRVVEAVAGVAYEAAARDLVLGPLGMAASTFGAPRATRHRFAAGHAPRDGELAVVRPWALPRQLAPASGLASSLRDLLRYLRFHAGDGTTPDGERLLSPQSMDLMRSPAIVAALEHWRGLPWNVRDLGGVRFVGHGGAVAGQHAQVVLAPARGFALVALANAEGGPDLITELQDRARRLCLGVEKEEPVPLDPPPGWLAPLEGRYRGATGGWWLDVRARPDGSLEMGFGGEHPPGPEEPPLVARLYDERRWVITEGRSQGKRGEFVRDEAGRVTWVRWVGRLVARRE